MRKHNDIYGGADWGASSIDNNKYKEQYSYDANGNIQTLLRNGAGTTTNPAAMDNLVYWYYYMASNDTWQVYNSSNMPVTTNVKYLTNRLAYVTDAVTATNYTIDIDNQSTSNYTYDKIGNMIADVVEGVTSIRWNVYGKIKSVVKNKNNLTTNISYEYDISGNRVMKQVGEKTTFYIRDAQGNVMGVYQAQSTSGYTWEEQHLYGSSRLGMFTPRDFISNGTINNAPPVSQDLDGKRTYELSNHLGNVHVTICDIKRQVGSVWNAEILTTSDYYPFGMLMPERHGYKVDGGWASGTDEVNGNSISQTLSVATRNINGTPGEYKASQSIEFTDGFESNATDEFVAYIADGTNTTPGNPNGSGGQYNSYRYGFNGNENDDEVKGVGNQLDYGARVYDSRLGRWLSLDPLQTKYPSFTPYNYGLNSPLFYQDLDGKDVGVAITHAPGGGGTITFYSTIFVTGCDAADKVKLYQQGFEDFIKNNPGLKTSDGKWNVQIQMTFSVATNEDVERLTNAKAESSSENLITIRPADGRANANVKGSQYSGIIKEYTLKEGSTTIKDKDLGTFRTTGNGINMYENTYKKGEGETAVHEVLHLYGLSDYYADVKYDMQVINKQTNQIISIGVTNVNSTSYLGFEQSIMSMGGKMVQVHVDDLVDMALKTSQNKTAQGQNGGTFTMARVVDGHRNSKGNKDPTKVAQRKEESSNRSNIKTVKTNPRL